MKNDKGVEHFGDGNILRAFTKHENYGGNFENTSVGCTPATMATLAPGL